MMPDLHDTHEQLWSPLDDNDSELPPMEPLRDNNAVAWVLAIGGLGVTILMMFAMLAAALTPAIK